MPKLKIIIARIIIARWLSNITALTMGGIAITAGVTTVRTIIAGISGTITSRISRITDDKQPTCKNGAFWRRFLFALLIVRPPEPREISHHFRVFWNYRSATAFSLLVRISADDLSPSASGIRGGWK